ncbi:DUF4132 domain-containing protein [Nocardia sp. SYP-A9097]|nr:DUF4132 domain-containing protein [Nocardia sp. SYP-A9097]
MPKPAASDDPDLAPAAHRHFTALKKLARTAATDQILRLERAMVTGRDWTPAGFEQFLVAPPLLRHLTRRLVWTTGELTFRLAEDHTLADIDDARVELPETARIRIAHPLHLGDAIKAWGEVFADYEITQPFRQLGHPVHELTPHERATGRIDRFVGATVPIGAILGLGGRGWERSYADGGVQREFFRRIDGAVGVVVEFDPGIMVAAAHASGEQRITEIRFTRALLEASDSVLASEVLAELAGLPH